ncbi:DUF2523 domain-containing protein [Acinetobacter indicus]|uniref:DUF2523 domain-containing protein n=1 Tax=Acinetobacter indicus TaxID=756892 RepID=UPI00209A7324|nr:DUF2523 domain-containing protein [Acinetobacter indicus]MCO8103921.1 DUF2523 domain-containing protein [Acinetobacter indicus]
MPAILVTILAAFASSLVAKLLLGAGLAFVSYTFINDMVSAAQAEMMGLYGNLPSNIIGVLGLLKIPQALSVLMSAIATAAFIKSSKLALGKG